MMARCCGRSYGHECGDVEHLLEYNENDLDVNYDVKLPLVVNFKESGLRSQRNVVPMLPHTGVAFVVRRDRVEKDYSMQLLTAVFGAWPVLVLTLLLSVLAGIIAWVLENNNPKEFPRSFTVGACEGFWWAFVSMTTVGYGDRAPKSLQGRAFAVLWILIGICIISIFTATLTTSLTTVSLENKISLPGSKVASLLYSIETMTGFQQQADVRQKGRDKLNNISNSRPPLLQETREVMLDEVERKLTDELHKAIEYWKCKLDNNGLLQTDEILSSV
ncbi:hypothetical protein QZH41_007816 [Actinostola sp. cb2023]|nr:hypothetical protein QZH41_007816 [Actinostola sp. cb2023]